MKNYTFCPRTIQLIRNNEKLSFCYFLNSPNPAYPQNGWLKACLDGMILSALPCMISLFRRHYNVMCDFFQQ